MRQHRRIGRALPVLLGILALASGTSVRADDGVVLPPRPVVPAGIPQIPIARVEAPPPKAVNDAAPGEGTDKVRFSSEATWETAGYNNEEIVYTIFVSNQDTRILRCSVRMKGSYFDKGHKVSIEDRQLATVFPDQKVQIGNWMGMDPKSGATYSVGCHVR
jgi:hypothetical protein